MLPILEHDYQIRLAFFMGVLLLMACAEAIIPQRRRHQPRTRRWPTNLSLVVINTLSLKLLGPVTALVVADYAMDNHWGLLSLSPIPLPLWGEIILGFILLDLAIYLQHVAFHKIPFLWRLHKVHHADRDIDATTGIRFHPVEVIISMLYKCLVILLLGPITIAVFIFEILLNASAMFNHANIRLLPLLNKALPLLIITPNIHRVHHSSIQAETDSNYGFCLSIWDRLFRTYTARPSKGHHEMTIGLTEYQTEKPASIIWCLRLPFK